MGQVVTMLGKGLSAGLEGLVQLGRALWCAELCGAGGWTSSRDSTSGYPTGWSRPESTEGWSTCGVSAWGSSNLGHYMLRSMIHSGQLQDRINAL
jgi:hypothetical protein